MANKRDFSTGKEKIALRKLMLRQMDEPPVIMETHGGVGQIWAACYAAVRNGVVFEKNEDKAGYLARQRPTWAVYESDCVESLRWGAGAHLVVNVLDLDPWGEPWPAVDAFFASDRPRVERLWVVVQDGWRGSGGRAMQAWKTASMTEVVQRYGSEYIFDHYLDTCEELLAEKAAQANYHLDRFAGYYCGRADGMTHYLAALTYRSAG